MINQNRVEVIIPVYNAEKTLVRCVESIVFGDYKEVRVILVDDYSKDASWNICLELSNIYPNVFCIRNTENRGVSFTRNQGLKEAKGKYVLFVDSDDWVSGRYIKKLVETAQSHEDSLVLCGFHFFDYVSNNKRVYKWENSDEPILNFSQESFFDLPDSLLLQQLWNKVFLRSIIENNQIQFDITQSMGEDFQFVLDYMEAAEIKKCVLINEPLYYYIRWNKNSLMSNFGPQTHECDKARFHKLCKICGDTESAQERCCQAIEILEKNCINQMIRSRKYSNKAIVAAIEDAHISQNAYRTLRETNKVIIKEKLKKSLDYITYIPDKIKGRVLREKRKRFIHSLQSLLKNEDVSIISQNCIGGVFYHDMGLQFRSPTINMFFSAADFVKMVNNLEYYMNSALTVSWGEEYPIGILGGDISIHFMHYTTCSNAIKCWKRRIERINWDNIVVFSTDREQFTDAVFEDWKRIPYPKVLFTTKNQFAKEKGSIYYPEYENDGCVPDLIPNREFYKNNVVFSVINNEAD